MNHEIQIFDFEQTATLRGGVTPDGVPYVIAADVCKIAGHTNVSQALSRIDEDEKGIISSDTLGGKQSLAYVTESGFFALVLSFRLRREHPNFDRLKRFRRWVTGTVLPTLRKTGFYRMPGSPDPGLLTEPRPWSVRFSETTADHYCYMATHHPEHFSVVSDAVGHLLIMEEELIHHLLPLRASDLPDGSIGTRWAHHRSAIGLPPSRLKVPLLLPDRKIDAMVAIYPIAESAGFRSWLSRCYLPLYLPDYYQRKWKFLENGQLPSASAADRTCRRLTGHPAQLPTKLRKQLAKVGGFFPVGSRPPAIESRQRSLFD